MTAEEKPVMRWYLLQAAAMGGHIGATEAMAQKVMVEVTPGSASQKNIRDELDYLAKRDLIAIETSEITPWRYKLTRHGQDLVDYTIDCEAGIARPPKYWDSTTGGSHSGQPL